MRQFLGHQFLRAGFLAAALIASGLAASAEAADSLVLDKYVMLMRHGVRPQTNSKALLRLSSKTWPVWNTPDGQLTPHGAKAAAQLAHYDLAMLQQRGLLPTSGCPAAGSVFGWANGSVKRTIDTGNVVLATMFPGCGLTVGHNDTATTNGVDPLYAPSETSLGAVDPDRAKAAILAAAGGSLEKPRARAASLMKELDGILDCCAISVCDKKKDAAPGKSGEHCTLETQPWAIKVKAAKGEKPAEVGVTGPLKEAGTVVQVFLLQYAEGLPADQVAFGKASTPADIIRLSELRQIKYDLGNRVPYLAARDGSNLLNQLLLALQPQADKAGPPDARLMLFMGSDTQQSEIGAILGIHWHIPPYLDDETPPTGTLAFERLHDGQGKSFIRMTFTAPTLDQIRSAAVLDERSPPLQAVIPMPGCEAESVDGACPIDRFMALARPKLDMSAVGEQHYGKN
ncbi:histidine-type phosphatase [Allorhizobium sp. BGMRC 0089]|uniref:histidine-type phosphatase n=1 Tax=Allorhizobium sonneratiae TaxID=2934936 RepID=UPI00203412AE|nr:histidine-type phosphatase [Allorhizobium sonneratiae]MCM2291474.1 histidine-type phosphatase [Allorhizobium sonneratiae]